MKSVELSKVAEVFNGKTPSKKEQRASGHPVLKIKDIDAQGAFTGQFQSYVDNDFFDKYKNKTIKKGDTLILNAAHNSEYVGTKSFLTDVSVEGAIATGEWLIVRPFESSLSKSYAHHWLQSKETKFKIRQIVRGIHLYPNDVRRLTIPLPKFKEQERIAAILDQADAIRRKRRQAVQLVDEFLRSVFLDMFGDSGHNQFQWSYKTLPDLAAKEKYAIKRGPFGGTLKKEIFVKEGYLVYEQYHAINDDYSLARYFITEKKYSGLEMFKVKPGDLIISCSGVTLGRISEIPKNALPGIINQALLKLSLNEEIVNNTYFKHLFRHKRIQEKLFDVSRGSGIPNFPPMTVINSIKFPMPPIELQKLFAQIVQKIELMKIKFEFGFKGPVNLNEALTQRAFRGEL